MALWLWLSLFALAGNVAKVLITKRACREIDPRLLVLAGRATAAGVLLPVVWWQGEPVPTSLTFWGVIVITALITAAASTLLTTAVQRGWLAVVMPLQASIPVFMLLVLVVGWSQQPSWAELGLTLITAAAIALVLVTRNSGSTEPHNRPELKYPLFSLLAAALFGLSTVLDREALAAVSESAAGAALVYSAWWNLASTLLMLPVCGPALLRPPAAKLWPALAAFALAGLVAFYCQQAAVAASLHLATGVVTVKLLVMLHLPVVVVAGLIIFNERLRWPTLLGGLLSIAAGLALVAVTD